MISDKEVIDLERRVREIERRLKIPTEEHRKNEEEMVRRINRFFGTNEE